jgi:hypothetical protein
MKKPTLVVNRKYVREMMDGPDLERMLATGDNLVAVRPKKPTAHSIAQRNYLQRQLEAGYRDFHTLLPEPIFNRLRAMLHEGESFAELVERLLSIADDHHLSVGEGHN